MSGSTGSGTPSHFSAAPVHGPMRHDGGVARDDLAVHLDARHAAIRQLDAGDLALLDGGTLLLGRVRQQDGQALAVQDAVPVGQQGAGDARVRRAAPGSETLPLRATAPRTRLRGHPRTRRASPAALRPSASSGATYAIEIRRAPSDWPVTRSSSGQSARWSRNDSIAKGRSGRLDPLERVEPARRPRRTPGSRSPRAPRW